MPFKKAVMLPSDARAELLCLCCLAIGLETNLRAPICDTLFATDASLTRGGICSTPFPPDLKVPLYDISESRGDRVRLDIPFVLSAFEKVK